MSRSPWRDALDGQIKILRELRKESSIIHLARNADVPAAYTALPDPEKRAQFLARAGGALAEALETLTREAEPIYLSHDILQHVQRMIDRMALREDRTHDWLSEPLTAPMLPIPCGLIWLPGSGILLKDVPIPDNSEQMVVQIKAVYFGDPIYMSMATGLTNAGQERVTIDVRTNEQGQSRTRMGMVAYLDARRSGFVRMSHEFGDHLVPVLLGDWLYGQTLDETLQNNAGLTKANMVNEAGTTVLIACIGAYLLALFHLMLQRVTRWGGVGLNRIEQRDAERHKLRPRVQLVTWRKANYQYPQGYIPVPKNWSCRWSVREHYRKYKSGKVVRIKSYVKGPADKEFRLPVQRAHQVKR